MDTHWENRAINLRICLENIFLSKGETVEIKKRLCEWVPVHTTVTKTRTREVCEFLSGAVHQGRTQHHPEISEGIIANEISDVLQIILTNGENPTEVE
jgi:hypothetical protein